MGGGGGGGGVAKFVGLSVCFSGPLCVNLWSNVLVTMGHLYVAILKNKLNHLLPYVFMLRSFGWPWVLQTSCYHGYSVLETSIHTVTAFQSMVQLL